MLEIATLYPLEAKGSIQLNFQSLEDLQLSHQILKSKEIHIVVSKIHSWHFRI